MVCSGPAQAGARGSHHPQQLRNGNSQACLHKLHALCTTMLKYEHAAVCNAVLELALNSWQDKAIQQVMWNAVAARRKTGRHLQSRVQVALHRRGAYV